MTASRGETEPHQRADLKLRFDLFSVFTVVLRTTCASPVSWKSAVPMFRQNLILKPFLQHVWIIVSTICAVGQLRDNSTFPAPSDVSHVGVFHISSFSYSSSSQNNLLLPHKPKHRWNHNTDAHEKAKEMLLPAALYTMYVLSPQLLPSSRSEQHYKQCDCSQGEGAPTPLQQWADLSSLPLSAGRSAAWQVWRLIL